MSTIPSNSASTSAAPSIRTVRKMGQLVSTSPIGFSTAPVFLTRQQLADGATLATMQRPAAPAPSSSMLCRFTSWVQEAFDPRGYAMKQYMATQRLVEQPIEDRLQRQWID